MYELNIIGKINRTLTVSADEKIFSYPKDSEPDFYIFRHEVYFCMDLTSIPVGFNYGTNYTTEYTIDDYKIFINPTKVPMVMNTKDFSFISPSVRTIQDLFNEQN